mmetsp:Transcript_38777/g.91840  ORF Transcript_38777/g.91840 Transcript_38777/m.91840 type:complete len:343 (-) Transcript_38777:56-1084(-)
MGFDRPAWVLGSRSGSSLGAPCCTSRFRRRGDATDRAVPELPGAGGGPRATWCRLLHGRGAPGGDDSAVPDAAAVPRGRTALWRDKGRRACARGEHRRRHGGFPPRPRRWPEHRRARHRRRARGRGGGRRGQEPPRGRQGDDRERLGVAAVHVRAPPSPHPGRALQREQLRPRPVAAAVPSVLRRDAHRDDAVGPPLRLDRRRGEVAPGRRRGPPAGLLQARGGGQRVHRGRRPRRRRRLGGGSRRVAAAEVDAAAAAARGGIQPAGDEGLEEGGCQGPKEGEAGHEALRARHKHPLGGKPLRPAIRGDDRHRRPSKAPRRRNAHRNLKSQLPLRGWYRSVC